MAAKKLSDMNWQIHVANQVGTLDGRQERMLDRSFCA